MLTLSLLYEHVEIADMNRTELPPSFKGEHFGVLILVIAQAVVGVIHVASGLILLLAQGMLPIPFISVNVVYAVYTFLYGLMTTVSTYGLWQGSNWGWKGNIIISFFVIVVDVFSVLNIPLIAGVPKFAAVGEIPYSLVVVIYLIQPNVRRIFAENK